MKTLSGELKVSETENAKRTDAIKHIVVSDCGRYFATSDTNNSVCLFKKERYMGGEDNPIEWGFSGKIKSHTDSITGIAFGEEEDENDKLCTRLFSVGLDRRCFEYNVQYAKRIESLPIKHWFPIENESCPTACIWYPKGSSITTRAGTKGKQDPQEDLLLTVNEDYKMKLWNPKTSNSRRTCLGPTYGGEI
jgi:WD40 repeat protein